MLCTIENEGKITLTDKDYLASGGEASIYCKDKTAYKIYHDVSKMIPVPKIQELQELSSSNVLKPNNVIYCENKAVGYTMRYISNTHPLCKLFTITFRQENKVTNDDIVYLIKEIQKTIHQIHKDNCLIVDLNELNLLVSSRFKIPYFIDVDSYQTKSYHATAIMESIRDRLIKNNKFTELSDWFSFAVIACQLYLSIHPYKGKHPKYKPNEWTKRMDDGISIFDKNVSVPKVCPNFSVIPKPHLDWFKAVFVNNERSIPPFFDDVPVVSVPDVFVIDSKDFEIQLEVVIKSNICSFLNFMGVNYVVGDKIYKEDKPLPHDINGYKVLLSGSESPVIAKLKDGLLTLEDIACNKLGEIKADQIMARNGAIYSTYEGKLTENTFTKIGDKIFHKTRVAANIIDLSTKLFDGVVFQDLLGKCHITLPFEKGKCLFIPIKELDNYRILEAHSESNLCGVMAEKNGIYYRFMIEFDNKFREYKIKIEKDIDYAPINFTVMDNGACIFPMDSKVKIFKGEQVRFISDPPFDENTKLFNFYGKVYFIDGNKLCAVKIKK